MDKRIFIAIAVILIVLPVASADCPGGHCPSFTPSQSSSIVFYNMDGNIVKSFMGNSPAGGESDRIAVFQDGTTQNFGDLSVSGVLPSSGLGTCPNGHCPLTQNPFTNGFSFSTQSGGGEDHSLSVAQIGTPDEKHVFVSTSDKGVADTTESVSGDAGEVAGPLIIHSQTSLFGGWNITQRASDKHITPTNVTSHVSPPKSSESEPQTLMDALDKIRASMSSRGIYTVWGWLDYKSARAVERTIAFPLLKGIGENLEDLPGSICWNYFKPLKPESSVRAFKQEIPSMQLQAKRSTVIHYPGYYPEIGKVINPDDIEVSNTSTDLYYYRIIFSISRATDKEGSYEVSLIGKSGDIEYRIHLTPGNETIRVNSEIEQSIARYWPVLLDEVCVRIRDPEMVLSREFVNAIPKRGDYYELCAPVVLGTAEKAPAGNPEGDILE